MQMADALFYWLQMKVIWDARPTDRSAEETALFFAEILSEDHNVTEMEVASDEATYTVTFSVDGKKDKKTFDRNAVEQLLRSIEAEPKYSQLFDT